MRIIGLAVALLTLSAPAIAQVRQVPPPPDGGLYDPARPAPDQGRGLYGPDTGGDEDRRPELAPYQQGGGQQSGGPARNLIPHDNLQIVPR